MCLVKSYLISRSAYISVWSLLIHNVPLKIPTLGELALTNLGLLWSSVLFLSIYIFHENMSIATVCIHCLHFLTSYLVFNHTVKSNSLSENSTEPAHEGVITNFLTGMFIIYYSYDWPSLWNLILAITLFFLKFTTLYVHFIPSFLACFPELNFIAFLKCYSPAR